MHRAAKPQYMTGITELGGSSAMMSKIVHLVNMQVPMDITQAGPVGLNKRRLHADIIAYAKMHRDCMPVSVDIIGVLTQPGPLSSMKRRSHADVSIQPSWR